MGDIEMLARQHSGPRVSIYIPLGRDALNDDQNELRFRDALSRAELELVRCGNREDDTRRLLDPARELLTSAAFWSGRGGGLALFVGVSGTWTYSLSRPVQQLVVVGDRFHLKPLLSFVAVDDRYDRLAIQRVEQWLGTKRASGDLREIVPAACNARIDTLIVSGNESAWGSFDHTSEKVALRRAAREPGDEDLLNIAAIESLLSGATVRVVNREDVPGVTLAAAVFRYPRTGPDAPGTRTK
jgi:hypothetical protein